MPCGSPSSTRRTLEYLDRISRIGAYSPNIRAIGLSAVSGANAHKGKWNAKDDQKRNKSERNRALMPDCASNETLARGADAIGTVDDGRHRQSPGHLAMVGKNKNFQVT
jgi:hypothetical protein